MDEHKKITMQNYIASCPEFIRNNVSHSKELTAPLVKEYISGGYKNIWIVACGSSSNGSLCARQFVRRHLKCEVKILTPFQFVVSEHDFADSDMIVVVSQSGYSTNALDAIRVVRDSGRRCIGLTGDLHSDLAKACDVAANYGVGRETVAFVTRGVTTLALFFMLFAVDAAEALEIKSAEEALTDRKLLAESAEWNQSMMDKLPAFVKTHYQSLSAMTNAYVCGVGANLGTACEGALKLGETINIPASAYETEEYIHGPNLQLTPQYTVFLIDGGEGSARIREIYEATRIVTSNAYLITTAPEYPGDNVLCIPCSLPPEMTPLCFLPFFQLIAAQLADDLERWVKHPLQRIMEKACAAKSGNYADSPFSEDTPGRK